MGDIDLLSGGRVDFAARGDFGRQRMAEILGLGCTHRPVMLRRDVDWAAMMRASLDDPDMPAEMKDPSRWPPQ